MMTGSTWWRKSGERTACLNNFYCKRSRKHKSIPRASNLAVKEQTVTDCLNYFLHTCLQLNSNCRQKTPAWGHLTPQTLLHKSTLQWWNGDKQTLCGWGRTPRILCCSVVTADVLSHLSPVADGVTTLHTYVASFGVFPEDALTIDHT